MKKHIRLFEILFGIFALCLAVFIAVYIAADKYTATVNGFFGTSSVKYVDGEGNVLDPSEMESFERDYTTEKGLTEAYEELCQEVEEEGIVLMKNDNGALPLKDGANVSLFGQGSANWVYASSGSSNSGNSDSYVTLRDALEKSGVEVNPTLWNFYLNGAYSKYGRGYTSALGYYINELPYSEYTSDVKESYGKYNDAAIVTFSRESGEGKDITAAKPSAADDKESQQGRNYRDDRWYGEDGGSYLSLSEDEVDLLKELTTLKKNGTFKSIIVLLNGSSPLQLDFLDRDGIDVDAVVWAGTTGSQGLYGVAEVLCGNVNPSGKNSDTYLYNNFSSPAAASWGYNDEKSSCQAYDYGNEYGALNVTNSYYGVYVEGIYVGYRYFETRYEDYVTGRTNVGDFDYGSVVAYPFGYGLSYTDFSYSDFTVTPSEDGESFEVSVTVTNEGSVPGRETVEVYLQKPYTSHDEENDVEKASVELVGYEKTDMLDAAGGDNDSQTVKITVQKEQFKSYDANGAETYILDAGDYYLSVGNGAHEAVNNILAAKEYTVSSTNGKMDADGDASLAAVAYTQSALDEDTYSVSTETGAEITNQFDYADLKKYDNAGVNANAFKYVSRSDWQGTFPTSNVELSVVSQSMYNDLQSDDVTRYDASGYTMPTYGATYTQTVVDEETGEESEVDFAYTLAMLKSTDEEEIAYDDPMWDLLLDQMTYEEQAYLVGNGQHTTVGVSSIGKPVTIDENGPTSVDGSVTPYCLPCEGIWASSFNDELIARVGKLLGEDARMADMQGLYAPGVNIHRTAFCGRTAEYFSEDPYLTGMASVAEIKGMQSRGVIAYVKHFAFNEDEDNRNGVGIWLNEQSAREIYLLPFEYSMKSEEFGGANAHASMTSFNRAGCKWTSASSELLLNVARDEWNFEGFYVTDMASGNGVLYMTHLDGIMNGTNLYDDQTTVGDEYRDNARFCCMLRESCHRILYNVANYSAALNGFTADTQVINVTPWWQALLISLIVIAGVGIAASIVLYVIAEVFKWRDKRSDAGSDGGGVRPRDADDDYESSGDVSLSDRE